MTAFDEDAPAPGAADPAAAFDAVVADLARGHWTAVAAQCDPASLAAFHRELGEHLDATREAAHEFRRPPLPDLDTIDPDFYDDAYTEAAEDPPKPMPGRADARYVYEDRHLLTSTLGAQSSDDLQFRPPHRAFARWLGRVCPARRSAAAAAALPFGRPSDAATWHRVRRTAVHPGASPNEAYVLYHLNLGDVPPDATARRTRLVTCRRQTDGAWRLAAPDFLGADHPLVSATELAALAARYTTAREAGDLLKLAEAEDLLAAEAFYLRGSPRVRERERNRRRLYARYAAIFRAYTERIADDEVGTESLKRAAFLSWRAATGLPERTLLADLPEGEVTDVWEWVLALVERGELDEEWRAMLGWYYRVAPGFFDHIAALIPWDGWTLGAALVRAEGVPRVDAIATAGRGALGRYFAEVGRGDA